MASLSNDNFVSDISHQAISDDMNKARSENLVKKTNRFLEIGSKLQKDFEYFEQITTTKMMTDLNNVRKQSKDMNNNSYCRDDTHNNTLKCSKENCIKSASYKNVATNEHVCWYHSYVK